MLITTISIPLPWAIEPWWVFFRRIWKAQQTSPLWRSWQRTSWVISISPSTARWFCRCSRSSRRSGTSFQDRWSSCNMKENCLLELDIVLMQVSNGLSSLFYSIPPFTRTYLVILLLTGFGGSLGLFNVMSLLFIREPIIKKFEVSIAYLEWRLDLAFGVQLLLCRRTFHELCIHADVYVSFRSLSWLTRYSFCSSFELNPLSCTRGTDVMFFPF